MVGKYGKKKQCKILDATCVQIIWCRRKVVVPKQVIFSIDGVSSIIVD